MNAPEQARARPGRSRCGASGTCASRVGLRHELVGEAAARRDRVLGDVRHAVHRVRQALAVEVDAGRLGHVVREDRADLVALDHVEPRTRPRPVEPERVDRGLCASIWCLIGSTVRSKTLVVAVHRRRERLVAVSPSAWRPRRRGTGRRRPWRGRRGRPRGRPTPTAHGTDRARRVGATDALGRGDGGGGWCRGRCGAPDRTEGPARRDAAGVQAATAVATRPPPVMAPSARSRRRVIAPGESGVVGGSISVTVIPRRDGFLDAVPGHGPTSPVEPLYRFARASDACHSARSVGTLGRSATPARRRSDQSDGWLLMRATYAAAWARRSRLSLARIELT